VSTSTAADPHNSKQDSDLRLWRIVVFGGIGTLYLASLIAPPLREALAKLFSYFPQ
jgi:hypothetical protein